MLAPTFILDFKYPAIIGMLRELGFNKVTELTFGARIVNWHYVEYIKNHPKQRYFISSPCPICVTMIENSYPDLVKYLIPVVSPMVAMAKINKKHHPDYKVFFISPCFAKQKIEAPKYPAFIDGVITLKELKLLFENQEIKEEDFNRKYFFDSFVREYTKIYPVSGGLAGTSHIQRLFQKGEVMIVDSINNLKTELDLMESGENIHRFFDFLNCPGGCIGGPAINNQNLTTEQRQEKIKEYISRASEHAIGTHAGTIDYTKDIDFSVQNK